MIELPSQEQPQRQRLAALMEDWKQTLSQAQVLYRADGTYYPGDSYFCADGFFPYYYSQKRKVLFIARETVDMAGRDYIADCLAGYHENRIAGKPVNSHSFHSRMLYLTWGILRGGTVPYSEVPEAGKIAATTAAPGGISFAFMELSKYSNDNDDANAHRDLELMTAFLRDSHLEKRNFIREELALLAPDLVITMNLWETGLDAALLKLALGEVVALETKTPSATLNRISIDGKPVPLIDLFHFSSRKDTETDFYMPVMDMVRAGLKTA
jgi:hypothetical protein